VGWPDLLQSGRYRAVLGAHFVSLSGGMIGRVALTVLVYRLTGSPLLAAATLAVSVWPSALSGTLLVGLAERYGGRGLMVAGELTAAALYALAALPGTPVPAVFGLLVVASHAGAVVGAARAAVLPDLVDDDALYPLARAGLRLATQLAQIAGYALGGILLLAADPARALLLNAVACLVAAAVLWFGVGPLPRLLPAEPTGYVRPGTPPPPQRLPPEPGTRTGRRIRSGLAALRSAVAIPRLRSLLLLGWLPGAMVVVPGALAAPYVAGEGVPDAEVGVILCAAAVGALAGDLFAAHLLARGQRYLVERLLPLAALPLIGYAMSPPVPLAAALVAAAAAGLGGLVAVEQHLVDATRPVLRRRILAISLAGLIAAQALTIAGAGALAELVRPAFVVAAAGLLGGPLLLLLLPTLRPRLP